MTEGEVWAGLGRAPRDRWGFGWVIPGKGVVHLCGDSSVCVRVPW